MVKEWIGLNFIACKRGVLLFLLVLVFSSYVHAEWGSWEMRSQNHSNKYLDKLTAADFDSAEAKTLSIPTGGTKFLLNEADLSIGKDYYFVTYAVLGTDLTETFLLKGSPVYFKITDFASGTVKGSIFNDDPYCSRYGNTFSPYQKNIPLTPGLYKIEVFLRPDLKTRSLGHCTQWWNTMCIEWSSTTCTRDIFQLYYNSAYIKDRWEYFSSTSSGVNYDNNKLACETLGFTWSDDLGNRKLPACCGDSWLDKGTQVDKYYCDQDASGTWVWRDFTSDVCSAVFNGNYSGSVASGGVSYTSPDGSDACCGDDEGLKTYDWGYCLHGATTNDWEYVECTKRTPELLDTTKSMSLIALYGTDPRNDSNYVYFDDVSVKETGSSQNLVVNGGFEMSFTENDWARIGTEPERIINDPSFCHDGNFCAKGVQAGWTLDQAMHLKPDTEYTLSYWMKKGTQNESRLALFISQINPSDPSDRGYVNPSQQYFCNKDFNVSVPNTISYDPASSYWLWWNAKEVNVNTWYKIHSVAGTDFISNTQNWTYCDPNGDALYNGIAVGPYKTFPQGVSPSDCVCTQLDIYPDPTTGRIPECGIDPNTRNANGDYINCCEFTGGLSCNNVEVDRKPSSLDDCNCHGPDGTIIVPQDPGDSTPRSGEDYPDTKTVINPGMSRLHYNTRKTCADNNGVLCSGEEVCSSHYDFISIVSSETQADPANTCCVRVDGESPSNAISCVQKSEATCADQGGKLCPSGETCMGSDIISSKDEGVCCKAQGICYNPKGASELFGAQANNSFICYADQGQGVFGECCNELTPCYNIQNQAGMGVYPYDRNVFGVGTSLHSILSYEQKINGSLRTKVYEKKSPEKDKLYGTKDLSLYGKGDFSGFDNLEFDIRYEYPGSIVPYVKLVIQTIDNTRYEFPLFNYSLNGEQPSKWHRIQFPLSALSENKGVSLKNIAWVSVSTSITGGDLMLDNFHLTNVGLNDTYYCSGYYKEWINDVEPSRSSIGDAKTYSSYANIAAWGPYADVCVYNMHNVYSWTGTQCCGDDQTRATNESFEDIYGGCYNGDPIFNNHLLSESSLNPGDDSILYYDGKFQECDGTRNFSAYDGEKIVNVKTVFNAVGKRLGSWACTVEGSWNNGTGLQKNSRLFLASNLYNSSERDFTLSCGMAKDVTNSVPFSNVTSGWFTCILNNDPLAGPDNMHKVYVGILYNDASALFGNLSYFVPFDTAITQTPLTINETYLESCSIPGDNENFTKCPEISNGEVTFYGYHNREQKVFVFGFAKLDALEQQTVFEVIWNAIKNFFKKLFSSGTARESGSLELFPQSLKRSTFEKFYIARTGEKSIVGIFENTTPEQGRNVMKVDYNNFNGLNLTSRLGAIKADPGGNPIISYVFGCNKSTLYVKNLSTVRGSPDKYWRLFTSNIRIMDVDNGTRIGDCSKGFCGDKIVNVAGEECDTAGERTVVQSCTSYDSLYSSGDVFCSDECTVDLSDCVCIPKTYYKDFDNDNYSDGVTQTVCARPQNYKLQSELIGRDIDCDDTDALVNPTATPYMYKCQDFSCAMTTDALTSKSCFNMDAIQCDVPDPGLYPVCSVNTSGSILNPSRVWGNDTWNKGSEWAIIPGQGIFDSLTGVYTLLGNATSFPTLLQYPESDNVSLPLDGVQRFSNKEGGVIVFELSYYAKASALPAKAGAYVDLYDVANDPFAGTPIQREIILFPTGVCDTSDSDIFTSIALTETLADTGWKRFSCTFRINNSEYLHYIHTSFGARSSANAVQYAEPSLKILPSGSSSCTQSIYYLAGFSNNSAICSIQSELTEADAGCSAGTSPKPSYVKSTRGTDPPGYCACSCQ